MSPSLLIFIKMDGLQISGFPLGYLIVLRSIVVLLKTSQGSKVLVSGPKALHHIMIKVSSSVYITHVLKCFLRTRTHTKCLVGSQRKQQLYCCCRLLKRWSFLSDQTVFCLALVYWVLSASSASMQSLSHCNSQIIGEHHRKQRKMLNPVFSIAHMREIGGS